MGAVKSELEAEADAGQVLLVPETQLVGFFVGRTEGNRVVVSAGVVNAEEQVRRQRRLETDADATARKRVVPVDPCVRVTAFLVTDLETAMDPAGARVQQCPTLRGVTQAQGDAFAAARLDRKPPTLGQPLVL